MSYSGVNSIKMFIFVMGKISCEGKLIVAMDPHLARVPQHPKPLDQCDFME